MKIKTIFALLLSSGVLFGNELKVTADSFDGDEKKGIAIFKGDVKIKRGVDELNASKVTIYTDVKHDPTKMIAEGDVSFFVTTENNSTYVGKAQKTIYLPKIKEYRFYTNVHLRQLNEKKQIDGDKVILNTINGKAVAQGAKKEPVIMIFNIKDKNETK
ncbi:lipopolysaccharide transport periplasmic protein LptA [bacterium]|nr:lipopolysaccharide transport periplasmic protein LptA [bacterium]MBU1883163.1 lipopolysaccharide transport periplasmic protein LptA [bacterium]